MTMPDALRESWVEPRGVLSQVEYRAGIGPVDEASNEGVEDWLTGHSAAIERLRGRAGAIGREGAAVVLIHGEPGSGKLRVGQWMHRCGSRSSRPLLVLDGGDPSLEAQLDGVLTALRTNGPAIPGTIALRNCERAGEPALTRLVEILGSQGVELVCALYLLSKLAPKQLREQSMLHGQLLGRAGNSTVSVPALRHRTGDVTELARVFSDAAAKRYDKQVRGISPQALSKLEAHEFPGNIRELQAMIEQAIVRSSGDWVTAECFPGLGEESAVRTTESDEVIIRLPGSSLREIEIQALRLALKLSGGRIVRASELLGITRHALRRKLEKFGLNDLRAQPASSSS